MFKLADFSSNLFTGRLNLSHRIAIFGVEIPARPDQITCGKQFGHKTFVFLLGCETDTFNQGPPLPM